MIDIYSPSNTDFSKNGNMPLLPSSCVITAVKNGAWELVLTHPIDDENRWKHIEQESVVRVPSFMPKDQLFRIYDVEPSDYEVTAYARPIFMDAMDEVFLLDCRPTVATGQNALNTMLSGQAKYTAESDIALTSTAYYIRKNFIEALASNDDQSFLNRWGGEVAYDNFKVFVNERLGGDYGARAEFGFNTNSIKARINMESVVTRIIPTSYNGHGLSGSTPWVDSPLIGHYAKKYTRTIRFEDVKLQEDCSGDEVGYATLAELQTELRRRCAEQFELGIDKPSITYTVDMVDLMNTDEYTDVKELVKVGIGDTVHCKNKRLDIVTDARVVQVVFDCLTKTTSSLTLGDYVDDYLIGARSQLQSVASDIKGAVEELENTSSKVDKVITDDGQLIADKLNGVIDATKTKLHAMRDVAQTQAVRACLFEDLNPNSPTFGAMAIGTNGFEIADARTADGRDWNWSTFGTGKGFTAECMIAGILASRNYDPINEMGLAINLDEGTIDSKNFKVAKNGIVTLTKAIISGGEMMVFKTDKDGIRVPVYMVNENGWGLGNNGEDIRFLNENGFVELNGALRLNGSIDNYGTNGVRSMRLGNNTIEFFAWNDNGNSVGTIGSIKKDALNRIGLGFNCDTGDLLSFGYGTDGHYTPMMEFDSSNPSNPPFIRGTYTGSFIGGNPAGTQVMTVKNGLITRVN